MFISIRILLVLLVVIPVAGLIVIRVVFLLRGLGWCAGKVLDKFCGERKW